MKITEVTAMSPTWELDDKYTISFRYNHGYELQIKENGKKEYFTYHSPEQIKSHSLKSTDQQKKFGKTEHINYDI